MATMTVKEFCSLVRNRSAENQAAIARIGQAPGALSPTFSILRQELDSMIRVIYLLNIDDLRVREGFMQLTLDGQRWRVTTSSGKRRTVTDQEMVQVADQLQGWSEIVYRFGCAFVHLSNYHELDRDDPLSTLSSTERGDVLRYLRAYHGGPQGDSPDLAEVGRYLPDVLRKISDNLEVYIRDLEAASTATSE